jgi:galacturan 1,4-alpha-galacturonidase
VQFKVPNHLDLTDCLLPTVEFSNMFIKSLSANDSAPAANTDGCESPTDLRCYRSSLLTDPFALLIGDTYRSTNVVIRDSVIINGDDCVSFKPNSTQIHVENLYCDGSHGISVGSLGQYYGQTDIVSDVYAKNVSGLHQATRESEITIFHV